MRAARPGCPSGGGGVREDGSDDILDDVLWNELTAAVARAAAATLVSPRTARIKADGSPVTDADERSQNILLEAVARLMPGVTVVAEEMAVRPSLLGDLFIVIDPLDGTKEFVSGSGEYTVNLGIVRKHAPIAGIVAVPASGVIYRGCGRRGAERLATSPGATVPHACEPIHVRVPPQHPVATVSRSHLDPATVALLERLHISERVPCGSALKFCRIAEGAVDLYPRLAPTREWDIAAGHALVVAAGGVVTLVDGEEPPVYGDTASDFIVPSFIAWSDRAGVLGAARARVSDA